MSPLARISSGAVVGAPPQGRGVEGDLDTALARLVDDDPAVRRRAVLALGDVPGSIRALLRQLPEEPDPSVRHAMGTQLARHDTIEVVDGVIGHLSSDDAGLRNLVTDLLVQTPRATARRVPDLLAHADVDVRQLAVSVVARLGCPEVEEWLAGVVREDAHPNVVAAAATELAQLAGERSAPVLRLACERFPDDPFIAFAVARTLGSARRGPT